LREICLILVNLLTSRSLKSLILFFVR